MAVSRADFISLAVINMAFGAIGTFALNLIYSVPDNLKWYFFWGGILLTCMAIVFIIYSITKQRHNYRKAIAVAAGGLILAVTSSEISGFILPGTKVLAVGGGVTSVNVAPFELSLFIGIFLLFLAFRRR